MLFTIYSGIHTSFYLLQKTLINCFKVNHFLLLLFYIFGKLNKTLFYNFLLVIVLLSFVFIKEERSAV
jgi:hypothetical protein